MTDRTTIASRLAADAVSAAVRLVAVVKIWSRLKVRVFDSYRPELHYMRGPGPKWREKHARERAYQNRQREQQAARARRTVPAGALLQGSSAH
jgi:hypothetical protein